MSVREVDWDVWCAGPGHGGDSEAAGLDLRQHRGSPGRVRGEGDIFGAESPMFEESAEKIKWYILCNCVQGIASFIQLARKSGVCIAVSVTINRNADDDQFDEIVNTLQKHDKARVSVSTTT